jgi:hypothetical protein
MDMTAERYAHYCGEHFECYPEWGFFIAVVCLAPIAFTSSVVLMIHLGSVARERFGGGNPKCS